MKQPTAAAELGSMFVGSVVGSLLGAVTLALASGSLARTLALGIMLAPLVPLVVLGLAVVAWIAARIGAGLAERANRSAHVAAVTAAVCVSGVLLAGTMASVSWLRDSFWIAVLVGAVVGAIAGSAFVRIRMRPRR